MHRRFNWSPLAILICLVSLTAAMPATAAAPNPEQVVANAALSWTLPTTDTLGNPLTGANALTRIQVYVSTAPIPAGATVPALELPGNASTYAYETSVPNGTTLYFRLRACNAVCSAMSNEADRRIEVSVPNMPTGVMVTVTVDLSTTAN